MFIVFGFRTIATSTRYGSFHCPQCGGKRNYSRKRLRRFFTMFFLPVFPLDFVDELVECQMCRRSFRPEILSRDPAAEAALDLHRSLMYVLFGLASPTAVTRDEAIERIRQIYARLTGRELSPDQIRREWTAFDSDPDDHEHALRTLMPRLGDTVKEKLIRAGLMMAQSTQPLDADRQRFLDEIASRIRISPTRMRGIVADFESNRDQYE